MADGSGDALAVAVLTDVPAAEQRAWYDEAGAVRALGYPLPRAWQAFDGSAPPPASLEGLVGPARAALLRALDRPATAGRLAQLLQIGPSGLTHHLQALEPAGLLALYEAP